MGFLKKKNKKEKKEQITKRQSELIEQFNNGRVLQVDNKKDNKEYFKSIDSKNG